MQDDRGVFDEQAILTIDFQPHTQHRAAGRIPIHPMLALQLPNGTKWRNGLCS